MKMRVSVLLLIVGMFWVYEIFFPKRGFSEIRIVSTVKNGSLKMIPNKSWVTDSIKANALYKKVNFWLYLALLLVMVTLLGILYELSKLHREVSFLRSRENTLTQKDITMINGRLAGLEKDVVMLKEIKESIIKQSSELNKIKNEIAGISQRFSSIEQDLRTTNSIVKNKFSELISMFKQIETRIWEISSTMGRVRDTEYPPNQVSETAFSSAVIDQENPITKPEIEDKAKYDLENKLEKWDSLDEVEKRDVLKYYKEKKVKKVFDPLLEGLNDVTKVKGLYEFFEVIKTSDPEFISVPEGTIVKTLKPAILNREGLIVEKGKIVVK